mmetsp:Transcript_17545/g.15388  ORF Transcript_17545/g.15388 Transcript_17545/m.15388 type:complete len:99 (+) Transcript_17545:2872-3168(+)
MTYECFLDSFSAFMEEMQSKTNIYDRKLNSLKEDINIVGELYGEDKNYKTKDFIEKLMNFASNLKVQMVKFEKEKAKKEKEEEARKKKEEEEEKKRKK